MTFRLQDVAVLSQKTPDETRVLLNETLLLVANIERVELSLTNGKFNFLYLLAIEL